jgi:hypothetical protein
MQLLFCEIRFATRCPYFIVAAIPSIVRKERLDIYQGICGDSAKAACCPGRLFFIAGWFLFLWGISVHGLAMLVSPNTTLNFVFAMPQGRAPAFA